MKRLFRASKSGVDIPPELATSPPAPPRKSISSLLKSDKNHVSPFPLDVRPPVSEPINGWSMVTPPEDIHTHHPQAFYLPPGAGPPSPQMRPLTPSRIPHNRVSQVSLIEPQRERGYSSASASGKESEPSHQHSKNSHEMSFPTPHPLENFQSLAVDDQDVKEKKKFWGWADKRRDVEDEERGRTKVKEGDDVGSAIRTLCTLNPSQEAILDVCRRIDITDNQEVGKEAARSIRRELKNGNEGERAVAVKIWYITMKSVSVKGYRQHAASKKFLACVEMLLLAPKPLLSQPTYQLVSEVLAALTWQYGMLKGCEGLGELWRKVKLPQEPEIGFPLSRPIFDEPIFAQPVYTPDQNLELRRLIDECTAAVESARVLSEALIYTRPEALESKDVIKEFYRKCFLAHESISSSMDWIQAEAARSVKADHPNLEEQALAATFEAHTALTEALKQHEDLRTMAEDERELRQVRERSKAETRMNGLQPPPNQSTSREPSPAPIDRVRKSKTRTPSPDRHPLPPPPKASRGSSPMRASSPKRIPGPRPLPMPSTQRSFQSITDTDPDTQQPSRKALGKRRAIPDEDNHFNPDDMFGSKESTDSDDSIIADEVYTTKPVVYVYDAYEERQAALRSGGGGGGSRI